MINSLNLLLFFDEMSCLEPHHKPLYPKGTFAKILLSSSV